MAELAPLDGVEDGADFGGGDERFDTTEKGEGFFAFGAGEGPVQDAEPEAFEAGDLVGLFGDELVGEDVGALPDEVVIEKKKRLRGDDRLIPLTGDLGGIDEVEEARRRSGPAVPFRSTGR